jgi:hypothetical protein
MTLDDYQRLSHPRQRYRLIRLASFYLQERDHLTPAQAALTFNQFAEDQGWREPGHPISGVSLRQWAQPCAKVPLWAQAVSAHLLLNTYTWTPGNGFQWALTAQVVVRFSLTIPADLASSPEFSQWCQLARDYRRAR